MGHILVSYLMRAFDCQRLSCECLVSKFPRLLSFSKADGKSVSSSIQNSSNPDASRHCVWSCSSHEEYIGQDAKGRSPRQLAASESNSGCLGSQTNPACLAIHHLMQRACSLFIIKPIFQPTYILTIHILYIPLYRKRDLTMATELSKC